MSNRLMSIEGNQKSIESMTRGKTKDVLPIWTVFLGEFVYAVTAAESIILSSLFIGRKQG